MSANLAQVWDNGNAPDQCGNTVRGLTHSSDYGREGLAMKATSVSECAVPGCAKPRRSREWCPTHYEQWRSTGREPKMLDAAGRLAEKFDIDHDTDCWVFRSVNPVTGYGQVSMGPRSTGRSIPAHRAAWLILIDADLSPDLHIDHLCRNRACVNPDHLEPVAPRENYMRGIGPSAVNAQKTHCNHGHEFTPENTYMEQRHGSPRRHCRACQRRRYHEKRSA